MPWRDKLRGPGELGVRGLWSGGEGTVVIHNNSHHALSYITRHRLRARVEIAGWVVCASERFLAPAGVMAVYRGNAYWDHARAPSDHGR